MKRISLFLLPLALVAVVFAQDAETAADLVKKLGHDDYAVREAATKKLIELGDKARPELEKALKSEDLEVRLRAGRALRAIQGNGPARRDETKDAKKKAEPERRDPLGPGGKVIGTSLSMGNGKVKVKVTRLDKNGKTHVKEYEGASIEELKKKYPELKDVLGNFRVMTNRNALGGMRFDMDKFWKDFNKDFGKDFDKDFWKNWQKDLEKEADRLRRLSERWRKQWEQQAGKDEWVQRWFNRGDRQGTTLGATATRPSGVLDAQLGLRGRGIVIESVLPEGLAKKLGLQRWDILLELNGAAIRNHADVATALRTHKAGEKLTAKIIRRAQETTVTTK